MRLITTLLSLGLTTAAVFAQGVNYRGNLTLSARTAVDAVGSLAYTTGVNNFAIVDVSNPSAPVLRGQVTPNVPSLTGVEVWGDYAYCAGQNNGLIIIRVLDPAHPQWVISQGMAAAARDVAVYDTLVGVATATNVTLVGVRNPLAPHILATYPRVSSWIEFDGPNRRLHVGSVDGAFALQINTTIGGGDTTFTLSQFGEFGGSESLTPLAYAGAYVSAVRDAFVRVIYANGYTLAGQYTSTANIQAITAAPGYCFIGLATGTVQYLDQRSPNPSFLDAATVPSPVTGLALTQSGNQSLVIAVHASGVSVLDYDALSAGPDNHPSVPGDLSLTAYPNPFNGVVTLTMSVPRSGLYHLKLFDTLGREISSETRQLTGVSTQTLDFSGYAAGTYIARLSGAGSESPTRLIYLP